jgi:hypothetical protein
VTSLFSKIDRDLGQLTALVNDGWLAKEKST